MQPIQIAVVTANDLIRAGIQMIIHRANRNIMLVGSFGSLIECEAYLQQKRIEVLLLDDAAPDCPRPVQVVARLCQRHPAARIVMLSNYLNDYYVQRLLDCGAAGFIYKADRLDDTLVSGILTVMDEAVYLSPKASALPYKRGGHSDLNATDRAVLDLLAAGYTVKETASRLDIVTRSVYRIRAKLREYLNVRTNEQIVEAARRRGLLREPESGHKALG